VSAQGALLASLVVSISVVALIGIATHRNGTRALCFLVGASASLVAVQVANVHVFTLLILALAVFSRKRTLGVGGYAVALTASVALVAVTAITGELVTNTGLALQLLALGACSLLFVYRADRAMFRIASFGLLVGISASSLISVLQVIGVVPYQLFATGELHRPAGLYPEPDWLGLMAAVGVLLAWELRGRPVIQASLLLLNIVAVVLSSARAALVALGFVLVFYVFRAIWRRLQSKARRTGRVAKLPIAVLAFALLAVLVLLPAEAALLSSRILSAVDAGNQDSAALVRVMQLAGLQALADSAPWYGWGLSSSGRISGYGQLLAHRSDSVGSAGTNWILSLWADSKMLAIPLIAIMSVTAVRGAWRGSPILLLVLINSLFSNTFFFPITWMAVALAVGAIQRHREVPVDESNRRSELGVVSFGEPHSRTQIG
jgi:hypothetical protein